MASLALGFKHNQGEEELGDKISKRSQKERPLHSYFNRCQLRRDAKCLEVRVKQLTGHRELYWMNAPHLRQLCNCHCQSHG